MQWTKNPLQGTGASKQPWVTASTACPGIPSSPASSGAARRGQEPHLPAWSQRTHIPALQGEGTSPGTQHPGAEQKNACGGYRGCSTGAHGQPCSPSTARQKPTSPDHQSLTRAPTCKNHLLLLTVAARPWIALLLTHTHRYTNAPSLLPDAPVIFYSSLSMGCKSPPRATGRYRGTSPC